eukprot:1141701-Pelagomonas_calceolata.AAC.6
MPGLCTVLLDCARDKPGDAGIWYMLAVRWGVGAEQIGRHDRHHHLARAPAFIGQREGGNGVVGLLWDQARRGAQVQVGSWHLWTTDVNENKA